MSYCSLTLKDIFREPCGFGAAAARDMAGRVEDDRDQKAGWWEGGVGLIDIGAVAQSPGSSACGERGWLTINTSDLLYTA